MAFRIQDVISQLGEVGSRVVGAARDNPNLTAGILGGIGTIAAGRYGGSPGIRALGSAVEAVGEKRKKDELDRVRKVKDELERQRAEKLLLDADLSMQERQHRMDISEREQSRKDLEGWDNLFDDNSGKKGRSRGGLSGMPGKLSFATPVSPPSLDEAGVLSLSEKDAGKIQGEANKLAAMLKKERFTLNDVQDSWRKIAGSEDFKGYHGPNGEETVASKLLRKKTLEHFQQESKLGQMQAARAEGGRAPPGFLSRAMNEPWAETVGSMIPNVAMNASEEILDAPQGLADILDQRWAGRPAPPPMPSPAGGMARGLPSPSDLGGRNTEETLSESVRRILDQLGEAPGSSTPAGLDQATRRATGLLPNMGGVRDMISRSFRR